MKTTTNIFAAILCAVALIWSGCSKIDEAYEGKGGELPTAMGIDPTLGSHIDSRAVIEGESLPDGASFSLFGYRNDAIYTDVITGKDLNHKQVTYSAVNQTGVLADDPIYWPASGLDTSPITFYALYPHTAVNTKALADAAKGDYYISESTKDGIKFVYYIGDNSDKDLMLAKTTSSAIPSNGAAQLTFYHVLVLLDVQISLDDQRADKTEQIKVTGITQDGLRVKGMFNQSSFVSGAWSGTELEARALNLHNGSTSIVLQDDADDDTYQEVASIMSIPLSASGFSDGKDMTITYTIGSDATPKTLTVSHDKLPKMSEYGKRYKLKINLAAKDALMLLDVETDVDDWGSKTVNIIHDGQWWLTVDKDVLELAGDSGAEGSIIAETNYNETTFGYPKGLVYSAITYDSDCDETDWLSMSVVKEGDLKGTMNFETTKANESNEDRVAYVKVTAGNLTKQLIIKQKQVLPDIPNPEDHDNATSIPSTYIGAFWRNNQKGERLIKIARSANAHLGHWCVQVLDYHTGSNKLFKEGDILFEDWDGTLPDPAGPFGENVDTPELTAPTMILTGKLESAGEITFKIGLRSKYTPTGTNYARYARVLLSYGGDSKGYKYHHVLWLRQGEDDDYLMTPDDGTIVAGWDDNDDVIIAPRTTATRWSPYNLTASKWADVPNAYETQELIQLRGRTEAVGDDDSKFVPYPSMSGAQFQWVNEYRDEDRRLAFNPGTLQLSVYDVSIGKEHLWLWSDKHETCPPGYRRPTNDNNKENGRYFEISTSLMNRSSYEESMDGGTFINGYYADGYFDRLNKDNKAVVNEGKNTIAYAGHLLVNTIESSSHKNASLFFPAAGIRFFDQYPEGGLVNYVNNSNIFFGGYYWGVITVPQDEYGPNKSNGGENFMFTTVQNFSVYYSDSSGACTNINNIRCVKE